MSVEVNIFKFYETMLCVNLLLVLLCIKVFFFAVECDKFSCFQFSIEFNEFLTISP